MRSPSGCALPGDPTREGVTKRAKHKRGVRSCFLCRLFFCSCVRFGGPSYCVCVEVGGGGPDSDTGLAKANTKRPPIRDADNFFVARGGETEFFLFRAGGLGSPPSCASPSWLLPPGPGLPGVRNHSGFALSGGEEFCTKFKARFAPFTAPRRR